MDFQTEATMAALAQEAARQERTIARLEATVESQQATIRLLREQLGAKSPAAFEQVAGMQAEIQNLRRWTVEELANLRRRAAKLEAK